MNKENINPNERSTSSQNALILTHLMKGGTITTLTAVRRPFRCCRLSGRIWDLRNEGHDIKDMWKVVGPDKKRVKEYYMETA